MITTTNITQARKEIESLFAKKKKVIVLGNTIEFNRQILENKKVDKLILDLEQGHDKLYQRDSGLNHILIKIAKENKTELAVNLEQITKQKSKKQKAKIISRLIQNITLSKKAKYPIKIISTKNNYDIKSLLLTLGLSTDLIKKSI
ncbi:MAG: hypothetical protein KKF56_00355 [Nanoarchaeota archaeon]|nr:hypothetical protein [Nanoarchaeota archaeon]